MDIVAQEIDLAVRITSLRDNTLVARRLADNPRRLYVSPAYAATHGLPETPADLARHRCLALTGASHWNFLAGGRTLRQRVSGPYLKLGRRVAPGLPRHHHVVGMGRGGGSCCRSFASGSAGPLAAGSPSDLGSLSDGPARSAKGAVLYRCAGSQARPGRGPRLSFTMIASASCDDRVLNAPGRTAQKAGQQTPRRR